MKQRIKGWREMGFPQKSEACYELKISSYPLLIHLREDFKKQFRFIYSVSCHYLCFLQIRQLHSVDTNTYSKAVVCYSLVARL